MRHPLHLSTRWFDNDDEHFPKDAKAIVLHPDLGLHVGVAFIELDAIIHVLLLHTRDGCGWEAKVDIRHIIVYWLFFHPDDFWRAALPGRISRLLLWICIIVLPRFPHRLACSWVENNVLLEQDRVALIHSPEEVAHSKVLCRKDIYFGFLRGHH